jgi:hypothetical protein
VFLELQEVVAMSVLTATAGSYPAVRLEQRTWRPHPLLLRRFAAALVAVFVLFSPYLANLTRDYTRYCWLWRRSDTLLLVGLILALACVCTALGEIVRTSGRPWLTRVFNHVFLAAMGIGLLANAGFLAAKFPVLGWQLSGWQMQTAWIVLAVVVGYSFGRRESRLVRWCGQLCLMAVAVVPLTFASLLCGSTYPDGMEPLRLCGKVCPTARPVEASPRGGIYVFLFDEWSYERTFKGGQPLAAYPNLAAFAATSTVFTDAHSPGEKTEESIPDILLQTDDHVIVSGRRLGFAKSDGTFVAASERCSVFKRLEASGYRSAMIGFGLPYRSWLGGQVDVARTYCYYPRAEDWLTRLGIHLFNAARYSPDPWSPRSYKQLEGRLMHDVTRGILESLRRDVRTVAREWPDNTFLFVHFYLPHMPAVMNPDLTFRDAAHTSWMDGDLAAYQANLAATDGMLGDLVDALRSAGKYEDAIIVLTSDHTWRSDPDWAAGRLQGRKTHVPLLVKAPGQQDGEVVDRRFETKDLGALIESLTRSGSLKAAPPVANHEP